MLKSLELFGVSEQCTVHVLYVHLMKYTVLYMYRASHHTLNRFASPAVHPHHSRHHSPCTQLQRPYQMEAQMCLKSVSMPGFEQRIAQISPSLILAGLALLAARKSKARMSSFARTSRYSIYTQPCMYSSVITHG